MWGGNGTGFKAHNTGSGNDADSNHSFDEVPNDEPQDNLEGKTGTMCRLHGEGNAQSR